MAIQKNSNSNNNTNENSGFKTVAFGFDKNDVTMYIASLRKKMKAMEESYEERIAEMEREGGYVPPAPSQNDDNAQPSAPSEPVNVGQDQLEAIRAAASEFYSKKVEDAKAENKELLAELDGIKEVHSKEIEELNEAHRAELEKIKNDLTEKHEKTQKDLTAKLEQAQKDQFAQVDKVTRQLEAMQRENDSLKEQLNAYSKVGMQNNELAENTIRTIGDALVNAEKIKENAKQLASFSAMAKIIAESTEQFNELLKKQEENAKQLQKITTYASAVSINTDQITDMLSAQKARLEGETSGPAYSIPKSTEAAMPSFSINQNEEEEEIAAPTVEEEPEYKPAEPAVQESKPDIDDFTVPFDAEEETVTELKSQPVVEQNSDFDGLADLMAEEEVAVEPASAKPEADIDFSDLLADDDDDQSTNDVFIQGLDGKIADKGDDLGDDLYKIIIDHDEQAKKADLGAMLSEQEQHDIEENKRVQIQPTEVDDELASLIAAAEAAAVPDMDERISKAAQKQEEAMMEAENSVKPLNSENDVFNFAFDDNTDGDDDDDMSTDNFDFSSMM